MLPSVIGMALTSSAATVSCEKGETGKWIQNGYFIGPPCYLISSKLYLTHRSRARAFTLTEKSFLQISLTATIRFGETEILLRSSHRWGSFYCLPHVSARDLKTGKGKEKHWKLCRRSAISCKACLIQTLGRDSLTFPFELSVCLLKA